MVAYAFFVGLDGEGGVGRELEREATEYGDIVIVNKTDTYANMMYKAVSIFRYGSRVCGSTYVMRSNDDVYLRLGVVLSDLSSFLNCESFLWTC